MEQLAIHLKFNAKLLFEIAIVASAFNHHRFPGGREGGGGGGEFHTSYYMKIFIKY